MSMNHSLADNHPPSVSNTRIIAYNTIIQTVGKAATVGVSFFLFRAIARYLGVTGVGEYTTIFAYINLLANFSDLGFQIILVRSWATAATAAERTRIVSTIVSMRTVVALGVFSLGAWAAQFIPYTGTVKLGIVVGALAIFWLSINTTLVGIFQANLRMDKPVFTDLFGRIITFLGVLAVVRSGHGIIAIMGAYVVGNLINLLLNLFFTREYVRIHFLFDWPAWKRYFGQAISLGLILIFSYVYLKIDAVILSLMRGSFDVGIYGVAYKILEILLLFPALFLGVIFPLFARYGVGDRERLERIFHKSHDVLVMVGLPIMVGVSLLARPIIDILGGAEFLTAASVTIFGNPVTAATVLQILMVTVFLTYLSQTYHYLLVATGHQQKLVWPNIGYALFNILANILFVPRYSYFASAVITVMTALFVYLVPRYLTGQLLGVRASYRSWWKILLATALMGLSVYGLAATNMFLATLVGALVYASVLIVIGGIDREWLRELLHPKG